MTQRKRIQPESEETFRKNSAEVSLKVRNMEQERSQVIIIFISVFVMKINYTKSKTKINI
jgi:hypothetical protein